MRRSLVIHFGILLIALMVGPSAFAAGGGGGGGGAPACGGSTTGIYYLFCNITSQFSSVPRALAVLAYVGAVVLLMIALLQLKHYGDDPSAVPLRSIIIKFVLATLLISLPMTMNVLAGSLTGKGTGYGTGIGNDAGLTKTPCMMSKGAAGSLMALRPNGKNQTFCD